MEVTLQSYRINRKHLWIWVNRLVWLDLATKNDMYFTWHIYLPSGLEIRTCHRPPPLRCRLIDPFPGKLLDSNQRRIHLPRGAHVNGNVSGLPRRITGKISGQMFLERDSYMHTERRARPVIKASCVGWAKMLEQSDVSFLWGRNRLRFSTLCSRLGWQVHRMILSSKCDYSKRVIIHQLLNATSSYITFHVCIYSLMVHNNIARSTRCKHPAC